MAAPSPATRGRSVRSDPARRGRAWKTVAKSFSDRRGPLFFDGQQSVTTDFDPLVRAPAENAPNVCRPAPDRCFETVEIYLYLRS